MKLPFLGPAYLSRSLNMNAQRSVNVYPEVDKTGKNIIALYGTPGLSTMTTVGAGPIRGMYAGESLLYAVSGSTLYWVSSNWSTSSMGSLASSTGPVYMDANVSQLVFADGTNGYTAALPTGTVSTISTADADFTATPSRVTVLDGYAVVDNVGTGKFYISDINNANSWDALDFATAEGLPDDIVSVLADHRELWLFGAKSVEVWTNSGNSDFPFERIQGSFIEQGCGAAQAVCKADNSVFWLGSSNRGDAQIFKATGYQPQVISTPALEFAISNYTTISDALAWAYEEEGHVFIVFTFPSADATWVYDVAMSVKAGEPMWHSRAYMNQATSTLGRHKGNCHAYFNRVHVLGDVSTGKLYKQDLDLYSDSGDYIKRLRSAKVIDDPNEEVKIFHHRLQILMETGVGLVSGQGSDPQVMMRYSNDGGHTWSNELWGSAGLYTGGGGNLGEYARRVMYRRLGSGRNRVYEVSMTDPVKLVWIGANLRAEKGTA